MVKEHIPDKIITAISYLVIKYIVNACMSAKLQYEYKTCIWNIDPRAKNLPGVSSNRVVRPSACP